MRYNWYNFSCDLYPSAVALKASIWPLKQSKKNTHSSSCRNNERRITTAQIWTEGAGPNTFLHLSSLWIRLDHGPQCRRELWCHGKNVDHSCKNNLIRQVNSWLTENDCFDSYEWLSREKLCLKEANKICVKIMNHFCWTNCKKRVLLDGSNISLIV